MFVLRFALFIFFGFLSLKNSAIVIRPIVMNDVYSCLDLDRRICEEFFKPLFIKKYPNTELARNPEYYLNLDVTSDELLFPQCADNKASELMYVAFDQEAQCVAGLIVFHSETQSTMEIDLLLVDKNYRRTGIGKQLVQAALNTYKKARSCGVYVFSRNDEALAFYCAQGFKVMGPGPQNKTHIYGMSYAQICVYCELAMI